MSFKPHIGNCSECGQERLIATKDGRCQECRYSFIQKKKLRNKAEKDYTVLKGDEKKKVFLKIKRNFNEEEW